MESEPDYLTDEQIVELGQQLIDLRIELRAADGAAQASGKPVSLDEPIGRLTRMAAIEQQKMAEASRARIALRIKLIGAALARIKQDEYGECANCGDPVGYERLKVTPESLLCVECQGRAKSRW